MSNSLPPMEKFADFSAPFNAAVSWEPLVRGGANFKTHNLTVADTKAAVTRSVGGLLFGLAFAIPGTIVLLIIAPFQLYHGDVGTAAFLALWGVMFAAGGYFVLRSGGMKFDKLAGVYYRGPAFQAVQKAREQQGQLSEVAGLQFLSEHVSSDDSSYNSYELNLVFRDGGRANVMDHGNEEAALQAAQDLADFLGVPLWTEKT
jgi:hypothetical protein